MHDFIVLDPACGSGNFLYIAYRELKRLEARLFERMAEKSGRLDPAQMMFGFVTARQFFGIDINPFAVELAKVTMMIARKLAIDELHITEKALPLDNLDDNFTATDALIDELGNPVRLPPADVIIGNPPFAGAKLLKPERGPDYVNAVRRAYPEVPGMADYCVYWFRKAHDHLKPCTAADPVAGRAGLVGTQNIRNNQSRVGGLDYVVQTGTVVEAVDNQPWSGEANVHVSIANWVKTRDPVLLPNKRRLWFRVQPSAAPRTLHPRGGGAAAKEYELDFRDRVDISSSLSDKTDLKSAKVLNVNRGSCVVCQGITPGHEGFVLSRERALALIKGDRKSKKVLAPYLVGREVLSGDGKPNRFLIDFDQASLFEAQEYCGAFEYVRDFVLPDIRSRAAEEHESESAHKDQISRWWLHWRPRDELKAAIRRIPRFLVCSRVTKRPIFIFIDSEIRPGDALQAFAFSDDYSFGVLQSNAHWQWFIAKCSKLKSDFRYTPESVFDTFPWPQSPTLAQTDAVAEAGRQVRRVRVDALSKVEGGLRAVYRLLELPGKNPLKEVQDALDGAVLAAYGFSPKKDLLAQLLALNLEVARREEAGEPVTAPGIPPGYPDPARLVTEDCIRAD
jgi:hypothetical protein